MRSDNKEKALKKAKDLGESATEKDVKNVEEKMSGMKRGPLKKVWDKVVYLWEKFKSPEVPARLKITIIGALLYMVLPTDIVPDMIPGIGLIDDLTVIMIVFKEVSSFAVPKLIKKTEEKVLDSAYKVIDEKLKNIFFSMLICTIWTLIANVIGVLIIVLKPFGSPASFWVGTGIFAALGVYTIVRLIIYYKNYGKVTVSIAKKILKEKSISKGIASYILEEYKVVSKVYAGIDIAKNFIPGLTVVPDLDKIIKSFESHYKMKTVLVAVIAAIYYAAIFFLKMYFIKG